MTKKLTFLCVLFLLVPIVTTAWGQSPAMKTAKVGVISAHSGPIAFYGLSVLRTVELAVKNINEKGTIGKGPGILVGNQRYKLEVASYDDSADPAKSVEPQPEKDKSAVVLEGPVVTRHKVAVGGREIGYTATAGQLPVMNDAGAEGGAKITP